MRGIPASRWWLRRRRDGRAWFDLIPRGLYDSALDVFEHSGMVGARHPYESVVVAPPARVSPAVGPNAAGTIRFGGCGAASVSIARGWA